ncbi:hypothetical protein [Janibacter sp. GS2]|uniref:hypothetical protein n=1 Tax=Janibacter sp. GS2 TaxID=3442646 RepID=UPI003EBE0836
MARTLTPTALDHGLAMARLEVPEERREVVIAATEMILGLAESLDSVPLGETPMAPAYDARWE